jgi:transposase
MNKGWEVNDGEWKLIEPARRPRRRDDGRGRPWQNTRVVLNGVLWLLGSGARWGEIPERFASYQTRHRRFQAWVRTTALRKVRKGNVWSGSTMPIRRRSSCAALDPDVAPTFPDSLSVNQALRLLLELAKKQLPVKPA